MAYNFASKQCDRHEPLKLSSLSWLVCTMELRVQHQTSSVLIIGFPKNLKPYVLSNLSGMPIACRG